MYWKTKAECKFHSVGQGLFYSCLLSARNGRNIDKFSIVYDCGGIGISNNIIAQAEITNLKTYFKDSSPKTKCLDLLVLSHLHDDHINGLQYLLENVSVKMLVMPYISEADCILAASSSEMMTPFLAEFYSDPVETLISYGVQQIILTNDHDGDIESAQAKYEAYENITQQDSPEFSLGIPGIIDIKSDYNPRKYLCNNSIVAFLGDSFEISLKHFLWKLIFQNLPIDKKSLGRFYQYIDGFRAKNGYINVRGIIHDKALLRKIANIYSEKMGWHHNQTSVMLIHFPTSLKGICVNSQWPPTNKVATLLTGDIILPSKYVDLGKIDEGEHSTKIAVLQVPHHGGEENWVSYSWLGKGPYFSVVSYGLANSSLHPHYNVVEDIANSGSILCLVNEYEGFFYTVLGDNK